MWVKHQWIPMEQTKGVEQPLGLTFTDYRPLTPVNALTMDAHPNLFGAAESLALSEMAANPARHWCLTVNNPDTPDEAALESLRPLCSYMVLGDETGADGTPHVQGYFVLTKKRRLLALKKIVPRAHLEIARGTPKQASDYCKKDGRFLEFGTLPLSAGEAGGAANKELWASVWKAATEGRLEDIPHRIRFVSYRTYTQIRKDFQVRPDDLPDVCGVWYYGPPCSGKSTAARALPGPHYDKPCNKWWDGYQGEPTVIVDDFDAVHATHMSHLLKRWADKFSFPAEMKGTTLAIRPARIVITSNYSIDDLFGADSMLLAALKRRFKCTHFSGFFPRPTHG